MRITRELDLGTLGCPQGASWVSIRSAYRDLVRRLHPDCAPNDPAANDRLVDIIAAYERLRAARAAPAGDAAKAPAAQAAVRSATVPAHLRTALQKELKLRLFRSRFGAQRDDATGVYSDPRKLRHRRFGGEPVPGYATFVEQEGSQLVFQVSSQLAIGRHLVALPQIVTGPGGDIAFGAGIHCVEFHVPRQGRMVRLNADAHLDQSFGAQDILLRGRQAEPDAAAA